MNCGVIELLARQPEGYVPAQGVVREKNRLWYIADLILPVSQTLPDDRSTEANRASGWCEQAQEKRRGSSSSWWTRSRLGEEIGAQHLDHGFDVCLGNVLTTVGNHHVCSDEDLISASGIASALG